MWMITGDKLETAENIGQSCLLFGGTEAEKTTKNIRKKLELEDNANNNGFFNYVERIEKGGQQH